MSKTSAHQRSHSWNAAYTSSKSPCLVKLVTNPAGLTASSSRSSRRSRCDSRRLYAPYSVGRYPITSAVVSTPVNASTRVSIRPSGPVGQDVAEADREEGRAGEVDGVDEVVHALDVVTQPEPDQSPAVHEQHDPHDEQTEQRDRPEHRQERLALVLVVHAPTDPRPRRPTEAVEDLGRRAPLEPARRDQRRDLVDGDQGHDERAEHDVEDVEQHLRSAVSRQPSAASATARTWPRQS